MLLLWIHGYDEAYVCESLIVCVLLVCPITITHVPVSSDHTEIATISSF